MAFSFFEQLLNTFWSSLYFIFAPLLLYIFLRGTKQVDSDLDLCSLSNFIQVLWWLRKQSKYFVVYLYYMLDNKMQHYYW